MDFGLSDREQELVDAFARFFEHESSIARVRAVGAGGFDAALWTSLVDLGVAGMTLPVAEGGATFVELALLCELAGRALASVPLPEALAAGRALARARSAVTADALAELGTGAIATVAVGGQHGRRLLPGGAVARFALVADGDALVLAAAGDGRVQRYGRVHGPTAMASWDLDRVPEDLVVLETGGADALGQAVDEWKILTAAALMGLARRAVEIGAEYATTRRAFGTPIGTFQGVAHPLADAATEIDGGTLLARRAAWLVDQGDRREAARLAALAWGFCGPAATSATTRAVHIHGGYGAALEYDIQLFHQRARAWAAMLGDPAEQYRAVGTELLAAAGRATGGSGRWTSR